MVTIKFDDIFDLSKAQSLQDYFSRVLGLSLTMINPRGITLTSPSGHAPFCSEILRGSIELRFQERFADLQNGNGKDWKEGNRCYDHFYDFQIPIKVAGQAVVYVIAGPVIVGKRGTEDRYRNIARSFRVDEDDFLETVREIKSFSFHGIRLVLELIHEVMTNMCEMGYRNYQLSKAREAVPDMVDEAFSRYTEKMLKALLETAFSCLKADRGSLMLWDKEKKELYIRTAKGLKEDIVKQVRLKLGQGLAGLAAEEKKTMFIDRNTSEPRLLRRMANPSLNSSLVIPLLVKDHLLGVLNLSSTEKKASSFSSADMEMARNLASLVETTLSSL